MTIKEHFRKFCKNVLILVSVYILIVCLSFIFPYKPRTAIEFISLIPTIILIIRETVIFLDKTR